VTSKGLPEVIVIFTKTLDFISVPLAGEALRVGLSDGVPEVLVFVPSFPTSS
jgi:hypothetical protein